MRRFIKLAILLISTTFLFLLNQCSTDCPYKLDSCSFPYAIGSKIIFKNNSDSIITNTVQMTSSGPGKQNASQGDDNHYLCGAEKSMHIGDFTFTYSQSDNYTNNQISSSSGFDKFIYNKMNIVDYSYKGQNIKADYYVIDKSSYGFSQYNKLDSLDKYGSYYYDYYLSSDHILLQYSIKNRENFEQWFLQD
jgi:hypothetical protein